ncbi:MAG: transketolase, partial [Cyclobacteriaceae bacterium]|nr:transketolase [Cyclobacteriaceae bacterium]
SALMQQQVIYVLTHDSIGLGEDGPTHQPVSHLTSLRAIPGMHVIRPADANETIIAWKLALEYKGPSALVLTRQKLPVIDDKKVQGAKKGGYVLDEDKDFDCIIIATGSEVHLAIEAKKKLNEKGKKVRVVSMPCIDIFDEQSDTYKYEVLPPEVECRVAVEAGATSWGYKYVGLKGKVIGLDTFGASAPFEALYEYFGITSEAIKNSILTIKN